MASELPLPLPRKNKGTVKAARTYVCPRCVAGLAHRLIGQPVALTPNIRDERPA